MVIKQFVYLVALAREQHFGRAAQSAHVSQPTLSAAIRNLEEEFGVPIVERGHKFNGLTREGLVVLEHARRVLADCASMRQELDQMGKGLTGRLRLGVVPTALPVVSHLTGPFCARYPDVTLTIMSMTSSDIIRGLEDFELEAALTYLDNEALPAVRSKPVYVEEYVFLTPRPGPYAALDSISWSQAAEASLCLLTPDMQNRRVIDGIFRSVGKEPKPVVETNSIFNLCSHPASGPWSSIVPRPLLHFFGIPQRTIAVPLIEPDASRTIGLIMSSQDPPSPLALSFFNLVQPIDPAQVLNPPTQFTSAASAK